MKCPECNNEKIIAEGDGIMSCQSCSLVFDSGPQWMKYKPANKLKKPDKGITISVKKLSEMEFISNSLGSFLCLSSVPSKSLLLIPSNPILFPAYT